jgi:predicted metal-binding protein
MVDRKSLNKLFADHGYENYTWMKARDIVVSQWARMKCLYGCGSYGSNASCPPNVPSVDECRRFFAEYTDCVIFHIQKRIEEPKSYLQWSRNVDRKLQKLERDVFISGYRKALILFIDECEFCAECSGNRDECKNPKSARPSTEAMAIDVYTTVRKFGFPIEVLRNYDDMMNRYAFLMIE